ncbi:MAG: hypothetical protein KA023_09365 [Bacteroidales bacterium]|nr:hypothetical protein [Bacteroidales bacterium]
MAEYKLFNEIISLSDSDIWDIAKNEWIFDSIYESAEPQTCLCGHFPIINICVIQNTVNRKITEVGNCCVKKFFNISDGDAIISSIKQLKKKGVSKSINIKSLGYIYKKNVITQWDYDFYKDIHKKRNLTDKQKEIKEIINKKFLSFTSYELHSNISKINVILKWAEHNSSFDTSFVISLKDTCVKGRPLSIEQKESLNKIHKLTQ